MKKRERVSDSDNRKNNRMPERLTEKLAIFLYSIVESEVLKRLKYWVTRSVISRKEYRSRIPIRYTGYPCFRTLYVINLVRTAPCFPGIQ